MKRSILLAGAMALAALAGAALAAPVSVDDQQTQTVGGQDFNFSFSGLTASDGTGGTLVLHAAGDYTGAASETLDWTAEGIVGASNVGGFAVDGSGGTGGPFDFANVIQPLGNIEWQRTYVLSGAELDALLADLVVNVFVDLSAEVGLFQPPNFVKVSLNYNSAPVAAVPLPAGLPLLLGAFGLLGASRLRRKS